MRKKKNKRERQREADLQIFDCPASSCTSIYLSLNAEENQEIKEKKRTLKEKKYSVFKCMYAS